MHNITNIIQKLEFREQKKVDLLEVICMYLMLLFDRHTRNKVKVITFHKGAGFNLGKTCKTTVLYMGLNESNMIAKYYNILDNTNSDTRYFKCLLLSLTHNWLNWKTVQVSFAQHSYKSGSLKLSADETMFKCAIEINALT